MDQEMRSRPWVIRESREQIFQSRPKVAREAQLVASFGLNHSARLPETGRLC
jgi:hypothetical protein